MYLQLLQHQSQQKKTALFAKQPNFHVLSELPKNMADLENTVYNNLQSLTLHDITATIKDFLNDGKNSTEEKDLLKQEMKLLSSYVAVDLSDAYEEGLRPAEWKVTFEADGVAHLEIFALLPRPKQDGERYKAHRFTKEELQGKPFVAD